VLTIGVFDGVHRGHQRLISEAVRQAHERHLPCVLLTFDPHPSEVVRPGSHPAQLTTLRRRAELAERLGVDVFCVLPFTPELSRTPADEFVHEVLVERLHVAVVVVGENFTFGYKAAGDVDLLRRLGNRFGFVAEGQKLVTTAEALGRPHRLEGIVVRGDQRGRQLGYPTANLSTPRYAAVPADGVYACWFVDRGKLLPASVSVGSNPTFSGRERRVEAYVLDVEADYYGENVGLDFVVRLREMEKFSTSEALRRQIDDDVRRTREALAGWDASNQ
jgi:riboflavin kinase / FMN adenylyltransferase